MRKRFLKIVHKQARIFVTRVSPFDSRRNSRHTHMSLLLCALITNFDLMEPS
jgi:hypothetical protein